MQANQDNSVQITGLGYVGAAANDVAELRARLRSGHSAIRLLEPEARPHPDLQIAALLADDWDWRATDTVRGLPPSQKNLAEKLLRGSEVTLQADAVAVLEALAGKQLPPERLGLVVGGSNLAHPVLMDGLSRFRRNAAYINPRLAFQALDTHVAATLAALARAQGPVLNVAAAAASGTVAAITALDLIRVGRCDACLVVGAMQRLSPLDWQALTALGALNTSNAPSPPFFGTGSGFTPGEGSACILLEKTCHSERNNFAELAGGAFVSAADPLPHARVEHETRVMRLALSDAQLEAEQLDLIVAHATGTDQGDRVELEAIGTLCAGNHRAIWVSTPKSVTGHCLGASGSIGLLAAVLMLQDQRVYPVPEGETKLPPGLRFARGRAIDLPMGYAIVNAFGFGGFNAALIIRSLSDNSDDVGTI